MKWRIVWFSFCLSLLFSQKLASQTRRQLPPNATTSSQDQQSLSITIYNSNLGLVKDVRKITLPAGVSELKFMDVAAQINPATVHIKSLTSPSQFSVQEQNYEYDLLNPQKLLDKYVGKEVTIVRLLNASDRV